jgi:hypothetical protein
MPRHPRAKTGAMPRKINNWKPGLKMFVSTDGTVFIIFFFLGATFKYGTSYVASAKLKHYFKFNI